MNWKWATATTFPKSRSQSGVTSSHRIEPALSLSCQRHWKGGRVRAGSFTNFTRDSIPSFHGLMELSGTSYPTDFHDCITSVLLELKSHASMPLPPDIALITQISHRFHQEFMSPVGSSAYLGVNLVRYIWPLTSSVTPANRHSKPPRPQWPKSTADTYFRFGRLCPEEDGRAKWEDSFHNFHFPGSSLTLPLPPNFIPTQVACYHFSARLPHEFGTTGAGR